MEVSWETTDFCLTMNPRFSQEWNHEHISTVNITNKLLLTSFCLPFTSGSASSISISHSSCGSAGPCYLRACFGSFWAVLGAPHPDPPPQGGDPNSYSPASWLWKKTSCLRLGPKRNEEQDWIALGYRQVCYSVASGKYSFNLAQVPFWQKNENLQITPGFRPEGCQESKKRERMSWSKL